MALQPHVKRHCSAPIVVSSGPTKRTKAKFDEFVRWVEAHERLPKRLRKRKEGVFLAEEESKLSTATYRWDVGILGPERFYDFE